MTFNHNPKSQMSRHRTRRKWGEIPRWVWTAIAVSLAIVVFAMSVTLCVGRGLPMPGPSPDPTTPTGTQMPDRWLTATPEATIPIRFRPAASPESQPQLTLVIVATDATCGRPANPGPGLAQRPASEPGAAAAAAGHGAPAGARDKDDPAAGGGRGVRTLGEGR